MASREFKKVKASRSVFTKQTKVLEEVLAGEEKDHEKIALLHRQLGEKYNALEAAQSEHLEKLLDKDDDSYEKEFQECSEWRDKYLAISQKVGSASKMSSEPDEQANVDGKVMNLPKIKIKTFSGDIKEWVSFWAAFSPIHDSSQITNASKLCYLTQALELGSEPRRVADTFPAIGENYHKVVDRLKHRYGKENVLVQVYVRELLALVISNFNKGSRPTDVSALYDNIETQLQALASLGRTQDKFADFLAPLVESCLPEDMLRAWQRKLIYEDENSDKDSAAVLTSLMKFLEQEVENLRLLKLAKSGFSSVKSNEPKVARDRDTPTAASLANFESDKRREVCIFCNKSNHVSKDCSVARGYCFDEKKRIVKSKNCCFSCLKPGHRSKFCRQVHHIKCRICDGRHLEIMCNQGESKSAENLTGKEGLSTNSMFSGTSTNIGSPKEVLLQTVLVKVFAGDGRVVARALFDTGSQRSYVSKKLVERAHLKSEGVETLSHGLFGGITTRPQNHQVYRLHLGNVDGSFDCTFNVLDQETICGKVPSLTKKEKDLLSNYHVVLPEVKGTPEEIDILFGADVAGRFLTSKVVNLNNGLVAIETSFGWTVMGKTFSEDRTTVATTCISLLTATNNISKLWSLEAIGIEDPIERKSKEECQMKALQEFQESVKILPDGRYQVRLPWADSHPELETNKELALARTKKMASKLVHHDGLVNYRAVFDGWLERDFIEKVPENEIEKWGHYLPHRPVYKEESSSTKIRPVFDASAHQPGAASLNDCVEKGPNLIEIIPSILERFRCEKVGVVSDIEKAFLQLEVSEEDRDCLRFFMPDDLEVYRHKRVVFGVASSPFLLAAVLDFHLTKESEFVDTAMKLKDALYVDNCATSLPTTSEASKFIRESQVIMKKGCFNLRGWETNAPDCRIEGSAAQSSVPVLGILWDLEADRLKCSLERTVKDLGTSVWTKRTVLSVAHKVFDPIGILTPVMLLPKLLLRDLWNLNISWDQEVPEQFLSDLQRWIKELPLLAGVSVPRCTNMGSSTKELHVFVDASKDAYAACAFLRSCDASGEARVVLVRAKSRLAPAKATIPRLELMACCVGARLADNIVRALGLKDLAVIFWSDSTTALWWILHEGPWTVFVHNRVKEIRGLFPAAQWRHVPGILNLADLLSRGCLPMQMIVSRWWEGPTWLRKDVQFWPEHKETFEPSDNVNVELRKSTVCQLNAASETPRRWYLEYFSSYPKIVRQIAWMKRYKRFLSGDVQVGSMTAEEILEAEKVLLRIVQSEDPRLSKAVNETVFMDDDGLCRVKTAISARDDVYSFRFPVLLHGQHPLTKLLVCHIHIVNHHCGVNILTSLLRENYWIVGSRRLARYVTRSCVLCRRFRARQVQTPLVHLPVDRVCDAAVFEVTGVDLAGPLHLKGGQKAWIVLFTCAVYRAIHLEVTTSLSTEAFLRALRRFIARRGRPRVIYSDNGTNFVGADSLLRGLEWDKIARVTADQRIIWRFNPPAASWWGGWWERLVGLVKDILRKTLGGSCLNEEELVTVICDCEALINRRPLTISEDSGNSLEPLSPASFLRDIKHDGVIDLDKVDASRLQKRARYCQVLREALRSRFRSEYLGKLCAFKKKGRADYIFEIGEVVLVVDDSKKRIEWPLGKIEQLYPGKDNVSRLARVKTQNSMLLRPVQKLLPLEVKCSEVVDVPTRGHATPDDRSRCSSEEEIDSVDATDEERSSDKPTTEGSLRETCQERTTRSGRCSRAPRRIDM